MIIGTVLGFLSFLFIPVFFLMGYLVRVLETTVSGAEQPPEFTDWGGLFVKGIVATVIGFAYAIVPTVVYTFIVFTLIGAGSAIGGDGGGLLAGMGFMTLLMYIPLMFLILYIVPAALTNYAVNNSLGAAFDIGAIKPVVLSVDYLVAMLMPVVLAILVNIVAGFLAITLIGLLLVPFLYFYTYVAVFRMYGVAFANTSQTGGRAANATVSAH
ncbi:DUF4013 domain-containing protein [Natronosalvus halobius]|uniref:DUF4013 domain-containing protein n=1 Tax=Natronosalvus halobius TaxID=2953746 RepID=UPI00209F74A7|nr:DUF4013 domain-containing protein [Natronosalvus halobius]USZ73318.1 DUF4013 domain-containing protein [Natronosalvus halobius]